MCRSQLSLFGLSTSNGGGEIEDKDNGQRGQCARCDGPLEDSDYFDKSDWPMYSDEEGNIFDQSCWEKLRAMWSD